MPTIAPTAIEVMNGYAVIAERRVLDDERVILAARKDPQYGFEYVTARAALRDQAPTSWYWGHYTHRLAEAVKDYEER